MLAFFIIAPLVLTDRVDVVELNHFYNGNGELVFDQVVWWDWNSAESRYDVVDWRLLKGVRRENEEDKRKWDNEHPDGPPYVPEFVGYHATPRRIRDEWVSDWHDEKSGRRRVVRA